MTTVRTTQRTWTAVIAFAILSVVVVETPANATPGSSVRDWNLNASNALFNPPAGSPPGAGMALPGFLHLAMQGAVYDAVNAIDGGYEPYLEGLPDASPTDSVDAAVATAAHDVLVGLNEPADRRAPAVGRHANLARRGARCVARRDPRRRRQDRRDRDRGGGRGRDAGRAR